MPKTIAARLVLGASVLAVVLPIAAALYLAHHQSMADESGRASTLALEVLRRAEAVGDQAIDAERRLREAGGGDPCSAAAIARMHDIQVTSSYLQAVGYVANGRLVCSSLGAHGAGIALGPAQYVSALGARFRPSVDLGLGGGKRFLVLQRGRYAVVIDPKTLTDIYVDRSELSFGVYGRRNGRLLSGRGPFDSMHEAVLLQSDKSIVFNGRYLVAIQRSGRYDIAAYAAIPVAYLRQRLHAFAAVLIPMGLLLGVLVALACLHFARQQASFPNMLRGALKRREFTLHYQPIVDLGTGRMVGAEALLRWTRADGTDARPDLFIPAAEDCGMIPRITEYVLAKVATDAARLLRDWPDGYISLNFSASDLHSDAAVASLRRLLDTPGVTPRNFMVEATEHSFVDPDNAARIVRDIRALGIRVAIDDFGTGYSSLSYLTSLQTDFLKIDRAFVEAVGTDSATSHVALHIIRVAHSLGMEVIGEGVETQVQADFLRTHGVRYAQGWLFARAMPIDQLLAWRVEQDAAAIHLPAG